MLPVTYLPFQKTRRSKDPYRRASDLFDTERKLGRRAREVSLRGAFSRPGGKEPVYGFAMMDALGRPTDRPEEHPILSYLTQLKMRTLGLAETLHIIQKVGFLAPEILAREHDGIQKVINYRMLLANLIGKLTFKISEMTHIDWVELMKLASNDPDFRKVGLYNEAISSLTDEKDTGLTVGEMRDILLETSKFLLRGRNILQEKGLTQSDKERIQMYKQNVAKAEEALRQVVPKSADRYIWQAHKGVSFVDAARDAAVVDRGDSTVRELYNALLENLFFIHKLVKTRVESEEDDKWRVAAQDHKVLQRIRRQERLLRDAAREGLWPGKTGKELLEIDDMDDRKSRALQGRALLDEAKWRGAHRYGAGTAAGAGAGAGASAR